MSLYNQTQPYHYIENELNFVGNETIRYQRISIIKHFNYYNEYNLWIFMDLKCHEYTFINTPSKFRKNHACYGNHKDGIYSKFRDYRPGDIVKFQYNNTHHTYFRVLPTQVAFYDITTQEELVVANIIDKPFKIVMNIWNEDPEKMSKKSKDLYSEIYKSGINFYNAMTKIGYVELPSLLWNTIPRVVNFYEKQNNPNLLSNKHYLTTFHGFLGETVSAAYPPFCISSSVADKIIKTNLIDNYFWCANTIYNNYYINPADKVDVFQTLFG
jgi:hypothetical protein